MEHLEDMSCTHNVQRVIPAHVRVIQVLLYLSAVLFTLIGAFGGLYWGVLAVGTLVFAWYYMGIARTSFVYQLQGARLRIQRISGFLSRPKTEEFAQFDLTTLRVMAPEGASQLAGEEDTRGLKAKRVTYDLTSHDKNRDVWVMLLDGSGADAGRRVKAYIEPSAELLACIRRAAPGRVKEGADGQR